MYICGKIWDYIHIKDVSVIKMDKIFVYACINQLFFISTYVYIAKILIFVVVLKATSIDVLPSKTRRCIHTVHVCNRSLLHFKF